MRKSKPSDAELAFHSYAQSDADSNNSKISTASFFLPSLVSKLDSNEKPEVRLSAIRSLTEIFTKNCAHQRDDKMSDSALASLREIILNKYSKPEHNEALRLICAISAGRRSDFSIRAQMLISDLLPSLGYLSSEYEAYRAFAISFLVANSIEGREESLDAFKAFLDSFISATTMTTNQNKNSNKNKRQNKPNLINSNDDDKNDTNIADHNENNNADDNENDDLNDNDTTNNDNTNNIDEEKINNTENTEINSNNNNDNSNTNMNENDNEDQLIANSNSTNNDIINDIDNEPQDKAEDYSKNEDEPILPTITANIDQTDQIQLIESDNKPQSTNKNSNDTTFSTSNRKHPSTPSPLKRRSKIRGSTQSLRELVQGASLIASCLPAEAAAEDLINELTTVITICIGSGDEKEDGTLDPLLAVDGLDLFLVVYECIVERQEELHISSDEFDFSHHKSDLIFIGRDFISHFRSIIETLPLRVNSSAGGNKSKAKAKEKSLRSKVADVLRCVDGCGKRQIDLSFNQQHVTVEGARKVTLAEAVKRVMQRNFLAHIQANPALQSDLGFTLVSNQSAVKLVKRFKGEIKQERVMSKKEREMDRMKKRKMKEKGSLYD